MAEEADLDFDAADAGASTTFPMQAGNIRKGGHLVYGSLAYWVHRWVSRCATQVLGRIDRGLGMQQILAE